MFVPLITIALFVITKNHHHHHHLPAHDLDLLKIFQTDGFWMEELQNNPFFKTVIMISIIKDMCILQSQQQSLSLSRSWSLSRRLTDKWWGSSWRSSTILVLWGMKIFFLQNFWNSSYLLLLMCGSLLSHCCCIFYFMIITAAASILLLLLILACFIILAASFLLRNCSRSSNQLRQIRKQEKPTTKQLHIDEAQTHTHMHC